LVHKESAPDDDILVENDLDKVPDIDIIKKLEKIKLSKKRKIIKTGQKKRQNKKVKRLLEKKVIFDTEDSDDDFVDDALIVDESWVDMENDHQNHPLDIDTFVVLIEPEVPDLSVDQMPDQVPDLDKFNNRRKIRIEKQKRSRKRRIFEKHKFN